MHSRKSHKVHDGYEYVQCRDCRDHWLSQRLSPHVVADTGITDSHYFRSNDRHRSHPYQNNSKYKSAKRKFRPYDKYENGTVSDDDSSQSDTTSSPTSSSSTSSSSSRDNYRGSANNGSHQRNNSYYDDTSNGRYHSKVSYLQKMRDKERDYRDYKASKDRDRDRERHRDRDRDRDRSRRSSRDRTSNRSRDHRTNHDRSSNDREFNNYKSNSVRDKKAYNSSYDRDDRDNKLAKSGDWSEHISSSGKKYYYNCKTEVSQWEKPREWIDNDREYNNRERDRDRDRDRERDKNRYLSSDRSKGRDQERDRDRDKLRDRDRDRDRERSRSRSPINSNNQDPNQSDKHSNSFPVSATPVATVTVSTTTATTATSSTNWNESNIEQQFARDASLDMDISPNGNDTPAIEVSCNQSSCSVSLANNDPPTSQNISVPISTPTPTLTPTVNSSKSTIVTQQPVPLPLPPLTVVTSTPTIDTNTTTGPVLLANALPRLICNQNGAPVDSSPISRFMAVPNHSTATKLSSTDSTNIEKSSLDVSSLSLTDRPPNSLLTDSSESSTTACNVLHDPRKLTSPTTGQSSQNNTNSINLILSPTLANFYREDLIGHVKNISIDDYDKEIEKYSEEASTLTNTLLRTSADLKKARSLVRCDEIKYTLQEQRILFLDHQTKTLQELKLHSTILSDINNK